MNRSSPFWSRRHPTALQNLAFVVLDFEYREQLQSFASDAAQVFFKRPFPPPSLAKHIKAALARRQGSVKPHEVSIPEDAEGGDAVAVLDKNFGFSKSFTSKYDLGSEVGCGHFGHTCLAKVRKGDAKGSSVAFKVIPSAKMTTAIAIEDVVRESCGHSLVKNSCAEASRSNWKAC